MKKFFKIISTLLAGPALLAHIAEASFYDFTTKRADGDIFKFESLKGKVVMIVNVASKCGFTYQYDGLEELYQKYKDRGFIIIGFPANDFLGQEPGTNEEIQEFCRINYGVTFPVLAKISVVGRSQDDIYKWLTAKKIHPKTGGNIRWNFTKFLIDQSGNVTQRFEPRVEPTAEEIIAAIDNLLSDEK